MYEIEIPEKLDKKFFKLARKNPTQIIVLQKSLLKYVRILTGISD